MRQLGTGQLQPDRLGAGGEQQLVKAEQLAGVEHDAPTRDIEQRGDIGAHDVTLRFRKAGRTLAVATIFRGEESLRAELAMERGQSP